MPLYTVLLIKHTVMLWLLEMFGFSPNSAIHISQCCVEFQLLCHTLKSGHMAQHRKASDPMWSDGVNGLPDTHRHATCADTHTHTRNSTQIIFRCSEAERTNQNLLLSNGNKTHKYQLAKQQHNVCACVLTTPALAQPSLHPWHPGLLQRVLSQCL